jgi:hypothetical protein
VKGPPQDGRRLYQTNGWTFWKYYDSQTGKLVEIDRLRRQYLKAEASRKSTPSLAVAP